MAAPEMSEKARGESEAEEQVQVQQVQVVDLCRTLFATFCCKVIVIGHIKTNQTTSFAYLSIPLHSTSSMNTLEPRRSQVPDCARLPVAQHYFASLNRGQRPLLGDQS